MNGAFSSALPLRERAHAIRMLGARTHFAFVALWAALITWLSSQSSATDEPSGMTAHVLFNEQIQMRLDFVGQVGVTAPTGQDRQQTGGEHAK